MIIMIRIRAATCITAAVACLVLAATPADAQELIWFRAFGLPSAEAGQGVGDVEVDATGALYAVGVVESPGIEEQPSSSGPSFSIASSLISHGFIRKYDADGNHVWTSYASEPDKAIFLSAIAVDPSGNSYVVGGIEEPFETIPPPPVAFIRRYDPAGNEVWTRQFGAPDAETHFSDVAVGAGGDVFVLGGIFPGNSNEQDIFVQRYTPAGDLLWTRQFLTPTSELPASIGSDGAGGVYVSGTNLGPFAGGVERGSFLIKLGGDGSTTWIRQVEVAEFSDLRGLAVDPMGSAYVLQSVFLDPQVQIEDWVITKFSSAGTLQWRKQYGEPERPDHARGITAGASGVYVTGSIGSPFDYLGQPRPPSTGPQTTGVFVERLTFDGVESWTTIFGSADDLGATGSGLALGPDFVAVVGGSDGLMFAAKLSAGTSCAGTASPESDEVGLVSGPVHGTVEPLTGPAGPVVHEVNCTVVAPLGL